MFKRLGALIKVPKREYTSINYDEKRQSFVRLKYQFFDRERVSIRGKVRVDHGG
jgi:hypothetical protein